MSNFEVKTSAALKMVQASLATKAILVCFNEMGEPREVEISKKVALELAQPGNFTLEMREGTRKVRDIKSDERVQEDRQTLVVTIL